ncbi:acyl-CoA dehydrogenase family protein [Autumnicola musiva]|uniref:Acyl-CoA dehydrogenase family protein n=1 Tax=Autumnicola musiva TaxID=3075589 RepID=A0ABU3D7N9_9FLAO|nr:acyl-CoA dehydrogenase family protein [Zunongwangia sp. F117]MDT0677522.1 acyl-CoA dehydrogenase family protein [Zunongwangia sp. F117]
MLKFSEIRACSQRVPDDPHHFPSEVFRLITEQRLLYINLSGEFRKEAFPISVFQALFEIGKAGLPAGRIYEGHINGLELIKAYGSSSQKDFYFREAINGKLFSVWNTEMNSEAVTAERIKSQVHLNGAKTFCSGGLGIDYALITAKMDGGKQLLIIPLKEYKQLEEDCSLWQPMGMKNSVSCRIDFSGIAIPPKNLLGSLNDYEQEPWFSGGAMRFAAVQLGGAEAVMIAGLEHLKKQNRTADPYQQQRMGTMAVQIQSGKFWLEKAQDIYDNEDKYTSGEIINFGNMMRSVVLEISENILHLTERSVGVQGFMENHPLERLYRDLKVYLKQPGPDLALQNVGSFTFEHYNL